jgi:SAM-dependent methyltransferase
VTDVKKAHWDSVYGRIAVNEVSWYEAQPDKSIELIRATGLRLDDSIIDVGGGASYLIETLLQQGYHDLTVLDISSAVLETLRARLGQRSDDVTLLQEDVTTFRSRRRYRLWHDRAVFHFLVQPDDRNNYVNALRSALRADGHLIIATFGPEGPQRCSGLPVVRYDAKTLANELGQDFRLVESSLHAHRTPSGAPQQFLYCRFQAVGGRDA